MMAADSAGPGGYHVKMLRLPLIRIGLLLIVAAVFASLVSFYIGVGRQMGDFGAEDFSTEARDLFNHFVNNFLLAGHVAGLLFWGGLALMLFGAGLRLMRGKKRPGAE